MHESIFDLTSTEETFYRTTPIRVFDNFEWSMYEHIKKTVFYKNSRYTKGNNEQKPFRNITRPVLNVQYRAEGFDVKDIELYVDDQDEYHKSFLTRKYHDKWAYEHSIDDFIDKMVESYVDFGGVLVKKTKNGPEVVPWQRIAFVDQTDIDSGPIAEKHYYSPDELKREAQERGWNSDAVEATLMFAQKQKNVDKVDVKNETPGRYVKVYEVHGEFPESWLEEGGDPEKYSRQMHVVTYYQDEKGDKKGIRLFKTKEPKDPYKFLPRDEIYGRALGLGGAEELFESQVWLNYDILRMKEMMDQASKIIYQTADKSFKTKNRTENLDQGEVLHHKQGMPLSQVNNQPINIDVFAASVENWERHAEQLGAATEPIQGIQPPSGTPFRLQALITQEARGLHEYRKRKLSTFLAEIYRDWIIPDIKKEIAKGKEFMETLDLDDLETIADRVAKNKVNREVKERVLDGELVFQEEMDAIEEEARRRFIDEGSDKFLKILEKEFDDSPLDVRVNIAGKQKDLALIADKLTNVFRQVVSSPQILQNPEMAKLFNEILESSGLSPIEFAGFQRGQRQAQAARPQLQTQGQINQ